MNAFQNHIPSISHKPWVKYHDLKFNILSKFQELLLKKIKKYNKNKDGFPIVENANVHLKVDKKNKVHVDEVYLVSNEKDNLAKASGTLVDLKDYSSIDFSNFRYKILDENGNYTTDWGRTGVIYMWEVTGHNYHFEVTSLEKSDDYYCVFVIRDVQNKAYYSNLISIE